MRLLDILKTGIGIIVALFVGKFILGTKKKEDSVPPPPQRDEEKHDVMVDEQVSEWEAEKEEAAGSIVNDKGITQDEVDDFLDDLRKP